MNIGAVIKDDYCNGFFGRRWDLSGAVIEAEGYDWVVIRLQNTERSIEITQFNDNKHKQEQLNTWI